MKIARFNAEDKSIQSVEKHLDNVKKYCKNSSLKIGFANTAMLTGILHDMGKLGNNFQNYIKSQMNDDNSNSHNKVDHSVFGAKFIYEKYKNESGIKKLTSEIISLIICYHHGGLPDCIDSNLTITLIKRIDKVDENEFNAILSEFNKIYDEQYIDSLFENACVEINDFFNKAKDIEAADKTFFDVHLLIKTIYSVLIDSDWFDSSMSAQKANSELNKNDLDLYISNLEDKLRSFKQKKPLGSMQKIVFNKRNEISKDAYNFSKNKTGIYSLTVPTGGGKTLASFRFALNHAKFQDKSRIFYIAPYTSIIEQNAEEIQNTLNCGDNLLEYHSNVVSKDDDDNIIDKDYNEFDKISERWDFHFVFTTMVQFLNTFFASPTHNIRRLQSFFNSIIIFDEVQTVPIECITLFNYTVNFLSKYLNCTIVLCTATQPVLNKLKKPIILPKNSEIVKDVQDAFKKLERVKVVDKTKPGGYSFEEVTDLINDAKKDCLSVLTIVNTVSAAENIYNTLKKSGGAYKLFYLSSQLCPKHRQTLINKIKCALNNKESLICISTQVIECGVDLSFDTVIRSIAGLDSIAQAAGRCNRHGEKDMSFAYIINLKNEIENTSKIKTIDIGKKKSVAMLELFKQKPEDYQNSLLSTTVINDYFSRFVIDNDINKFFDYPISKGDTSIFDILSTNAKKRNAYLCNHENPIRFYFYYQFKTARQNFAVIKENTKTLIVPHGEGKNIIADICSAKSIQDKAKLLKSAQSYSVSVYQNKYEKLNSLSGIIKCEIEGVYMLNEAFYNEETGITTEKDLPNMFS